MRIKIEDIKRGERLRPIDRSKVKDLADSIKEVGLIHPIVLTPDNVLVSGEHRIEAMLLNGETEIEYTVKDYDALHKTLAEIDENIQRAEPEYLSRGRMLLKRKELWEVLHPESVSRGGDRKSPDYQEKKQAGKLPSFRTDTAKKLSIAPKTVDREVMIAQKLSPVVQEEVRKVDLPKKDALLLIKHAPTEHQQMAILKRMEVGKAKDVKDAYKQIEKEDMAAKCRDIEGDELATFQEGDPIELLKMINNESFKAILTCISEESKIEILLREGSRILEPEGVLALMIPPSLIGAVIKASCPVEIRYYWTIADTLAKTIDALNVTSAWMPVMIYVKDGQALKLTADCITKAIDALTREEDHAIQLIGKISKPGDTILDPFMGQTLQTYLGPAVGRKFVGFGNKGMIDLAKGHLHRVKGLVAI